MKSFADTTVLYGLFAMALGTACSSDSTGAMQNMLAAAGGGGAATANVTAGAGGAGSPATVEPAGAGAGAGGAAAGAGGAANPNVAGAAAGGSAGAEGGSAGADTAAAGSGGQPAEEPSVDLVPADYMGTPWMDTLQVIPGRLEFEFFDEGGQDISFHEFSNDVNEAWGFNEMCTLPEADPNDPRCTPDKEIGKFRTDVNVDTSFMKPMFDMTVSPPAPEIVFGDLYVGWTEPGEWYTYTVDVKEAGTYTVSGHFGVNANMTMSLTINGEETEAVAFQGGGNPHMWTYWPDFVEVTLVPGKQLVRVNIVTGGLINLDWIEFTKKP